MSSFWSHIVEVFEKLVIVVFLLELALSQRWGITWKGLLSMEEILERNKPVLAFHRVDTICSGGNGESTLFGHESGRLFR